jgi:hypothetical protein
LGSQDGALDLSGLVTAGAEADRLLDAHLAAITDGVSVPHTHDTLRKSWLAFALDPFPGLGGVGIEHEIFKLKDALLRKRFTDRQIAVAYHCLTRTDHAVGLQWGMATYGGHINTVASDATASAHRDAILTTSVIAGWEHPQDEAQAMLWVRQFYRDIFADTDGVPIPGEVSSDAQINHADVNLADPAWNTSGVSWSTVYYKDNHPRLQQIKAHWDPHNVFHHALSIRPHPYQAARHRHGRQLHPPQVRLVPRSALARYRGQNVHLSGQ